MNYLSRRGLLGFMASGTLLTTTMLSGCVTTRDGTKTTHTLEVAKVNVYIAAGLAAANTVDAVFESIPTLAKYSAPLHTALTLLTTASTAFTNAVGDKVSISYDDANWKTIVDSVVGAIKNLVDVIYNIVIQLKTENLTPDQQKIVTKVDLAYDAISTVLAVFQAILAPISASAVHLKEMKMSEGQALAILNVRQISPFSMSAVAQ